MAVPAIFSKINYQANLRNAEVLANAFRRATIFCENCKYPQNSIKFREWLHQHIKAKVDLHRAEKHQDWHQAYNCKFLSCKRCGDLSKKILELSKEVRHTKYFLKTYWPCEDCITKYNPTGRWNHPPTSNPKGQEFINVRFD